MSAKQKEATLEDKGQGVGLNGRYITVEEYAKESGLSLATARRRAAENISVCSTKVGRQWLIRIGD